VVKFVRNRAVRQAALMPAAAAALWLAFAAPAAGLINPNYTPVDLVRQSETILTLEAGPVGADGALAFRLVNVQKGAAPADLSIDMKRTGRTVINRLAEVFGDGRTGPAMIFIGTYEGVVSEGAAEVSAERAQPVALLRIDQPKVPWFDLRSGPSGWIVVEDKLDMRAVWAGGTEMLSRLVDYILSENDAAVPVAVGAEWAGKMKVATIPGKVYGMMAVDPRGTGEAGLFILADSGDRMLRFDPGKGAFVDVSDSLGLNSKSEAAAWGDFDGDGRTDLVSFNGAALTVWTQSADGRFAPAPIGPPPEGGCIGLAALNGRGDGQADAGADGRSGILVSTKGVPVLLKPGGKGTFSARPVAASGADFAGSGLGEAGPCLLADFDGDGLADIVQPMAGGGLFYKAKGTGEFEPTVSIGPVRTGRERIRAATGDFDGDGLLDVFIAGKFGCDLWLNLGGGTFRSFTGETGEIPSISQPGCTDASACDVNGDGRQDVLVVYPFMGPLLFFNRGFACFGKAIEMDVIQSGLLVEAGNGQQAALIADLSGDGAQDLAMALTNGDVWVLPRRAEEPALGIAMTLDPAQGGAGPVTAAGWQGDRCVGAWNVAPGLAGALVGVPRPGPRTIKWRFPGGDPCAKQLIVETGVIRVALGPQGARVLEAAAEPLPKVAPAPEEPAPPAEPPPSNAPPAAQTQEPVQVGVTEFIVTVIAVTVFVVALVVVIALIKRRRK